MKRIFFIMPLVILMACNNQEPIIKTDNYFQLTSEEYNYLKNKELKEALRKDSLKNIVVISPSINTNTTEIVWEVAEPWEVELEEDLNSFDEDCTCE
jgi:hypothetical protein